MNVTLKLDSLLGNQPNKRIVFVDSVSSGKTVLYNVSSSRSCFTLQVQLNVDYFASVLSTGNFQIPLRLEVSYDYTNDYKNTIMSSMLDPWSTKTSTSDWKIQKSCSAINGTQCIHDLKVDTIFSIPPGENPLILGSNPGLLSINVTISNLGPDHSYFTRVNIIGNLDLNKVSGSCITVLQNESPDTTLVSYKASNSFIQGLMLSGKQCSFVLEYTLVSLTKRAEVQNILIQGALFSNVNATNLSNDPKILNNIFKFQKKVLYTASIVHTGSSKPIAVFYNRTVVPSAFIHNLSNTILGISNNITHEHTIYNRGPNLVSKASLVFTWPRQTKEGLPLLYLYKFQCIPQSICQCNTMNKVNEYGLAINNETSSANVSINFDSNENLPDVTTCNDVKCDTITCHVKQFGKFSTIVVSSSFKVWIPSLAKPKLVSRFSSSLNFSYTESPIYNQAAVISTATTQVSAYSPPVPPNDQSQDNIGAIIGAIVGGIILLITITLIMWKAGFFESKYARMQKEAQEDNTNDNTEH
uniref:Integrin alpha third immunoglobulin-like domain-containing protein n=1 Tax=Ciona savignyi TaxID=51511 RepID=H2YXK6_CIOSA